MLEVRVLSPIAKVLPKKAPQPCTPWFSGFRNEVISFQIAYRSTNPLNGDKPWLRMEIDSPVREQLRVRRVKYVPVRFSQFPGVDDNYLCDGEPGMYPDPLTEIPTHGLRAFPTTWESLWFDFEPSGMEAGEYPATIRLYNENTEELEGEASVKLTVLNAELPKQTLIHTKWFHSDCLASYYDVPVFSEEYWRIVENFMRCAVKRGINAILMPIHTPPLDTRIGSYRPAVQLVAVRRENGKYSFDFANLHRWVEMCKRCGVEYYEVAHLFSQWGAQCAPAIYATTENGYERIFGWDQSATGEAYTEFIAAYLPAVKAELKALGIFEKCLFHISDEPSSKHLEFYLAAKTMAAPYLTDCTVIDALSNAAFYDSGAVEHPVPSNDHIEPFLERKVPGLWTYYCCGQGKDVSNLFLAMPGARTRVLGTQLYKFDIKGFLQWGFNFYYSQLSDYLIDPWLDTDCDGFVPAGDGYQVYPGRDGQPVECIRLLMVEQALQDLRAMQLLETLTDRETVLGLIDEGIEPIRFAKYPHDDAWILGLRDRINKEIVKHISK